jgi:hypothetical protein
VRWTWVPGPWIVSREFGKVLGWCMECSVTRCRGLVVMMHLKAARGVGKSKMVIRCECVVAGIMEGRKDACHYRCRSSVTRTA